MLGQITRLSRVHTHFSAKSLYWRIQIAKLTTCQEVNDQSRRDVAANGPFEMRLLANDSLATNAP